MIKSHEFLIFSCNEEITKKGWKPLSLYYVGKTGCRNLRVKEDQFLVAFKYTKLLWVTVVANSFELYRLRFTIN